MFKTTIEKYLSKITKFEKYKQLLNVNSNILKSSILKIKYKNPSDFRYSIKNTVDHRNQSSFF